MTKDEIKSVELRNIKTNSAFSDETLCFTATIYINGKSVGRVSNNGCGGSNSYYIPDNDTFLALNEWAKEQPHEYDFEILDQVFDDIVYDAQQEKQYRRWCKNALTFRLKGDKPGEWRKLSSNRIFDLAKAKEYLKKTYGDKVEEILNDRFVTT